MRFLNCCNRSWNPGTSSTSNNGPNPTPTTSGSSPAPVTLHMCELQVRNNPTPRKLNLVFCKKWTFWVLIFTIILFVTSVSLKCKMSREDGLDSNAQGSNKSIPNSCTVNQFMCPTTGICIQKNKICDHFQDCSGGEDEKNCITLSKSVYQLDYDAYMKPSEGYLLTRIKGIWHPYCSAEWSRDLGTKICQHLGHMELKDLKTLDLFDYNTKKVRGNRSSKIDENEVRKAKLIEIHNQDDFDKLHTNSSTIVEHEIRLNQTMASVCQIGYLNCI